MGDSMGCALLDTGAVKCWGVGLGKHLGIDIPSSLPKVAISVAKPAHAIKQVCLGVGFACLLDVTGAVRCFGENHHGQLGVGDREVHIGLAEVHLTQPSKTIACGSSHVCALDGSNQVACWGDNRHGELGTGHITKHELVPVSAPKFPPTVTQLALADGYSLSLDAQGLVWQVGGDAAKLSAQRISPIQDVKEISASNGVACARDRNESVWCWGAGERGALGNGSLADSPQPARVQFP
jgi:alpha-tubulin suppressor-like RCC1 family protein